MTLMLPYFILLYTNLLYYRYIRFYYLVNDLAIFLNNYLLQKLLIDMESS